ncbi:MAG: hypothetical protein R3272_10695 [Candidatus Promineifilaceae bacterium]|nr:hypothetical protein [Candidatus Promineifilaceae bacterium]
MEYEPKQLTRSILLWLGSLLLFMAIDIIIFDDLLCSLGCGVLDLSLLLIFLGALVWNRRR